jgi:hypothetical protein
VIYVSNNDGSDWFVYTCKIISCPLFTGSASCVYPCKIISCPFITGQ